MTLSTMQLRDAWAPACTPRKGEYLAAFGALDACFKQWNYKVRAGVTGAYNCRQITGGTGYSLHSYGPGDPFTFWTGVTIATSLAVDVNWDHNPYQPNDGTMTDDMPAVMVDAIERIRTRNGSQVWRWGGHYTGAHVDPMHFEIVCDPHDLGTGIDATTLPATTPPPPAWKPPTFPGVVQVGSAVYKVAAWRNLLADIGYKGFARGSHGWSMTLSAATRRFQRRHSLNADGVVGPKTWAAAVQQLITKRKARGLPT